MTKELVIVESPAKARTIGRLLEERYLVKPCIGHVRDLPQRELGIDVKHDFAPRYEVPSGKSTVVQGLKEAAQKAPGVYLATDPDREGEAISWHLIQAVNLDGKKVQRVVFHEITKSAIEAAFRSPRKIDMKLVEAQQARRLLDRLVGYRISPLLWGKVRRRLSAGRVQSVALRMIVERQRVIDSFIPEEYWSIEAELARKQSKFKASLLGYPHRKLEIRSDAEAQRHTRELEGASYTVAQVARKEVTRQPPPPFTTATLQQEAWRKLRFTAKRTMALAQQLYEGLPLGDEGTLGLITYMRTDSTRVSSQAKGEARDYIAEKFGARYVPRTPRSFTRKAKGAQEAHEAVRPTSIRREPENLKPYLARDQLRLYALIWKRMVASQMSSAQLLQTTVDVTARASSGTDYLLRAQNSTVTFPGFLALYSESRDEPEPEEARDALPELSKGDPLKLLGIVSEQHFTKPLPQYTEATLVKALEENGIGRPSTYASIISILQERDYVRKGEGRFIPTEVGFVVSDLLKEHFPNIVDIGFTAGMEEELDDIARGKRQWVPVLRAFYEPFEKTVSQAAHSMPKIKIPDEPTNEVCDKCGHPMVIKQGRYGKFIACSGFPKCRNTKPLLAKTGSRCPQCGGELVERKSKKKRTFYGCVNFPKCEFTIRRRPLPQPCPNCGGLLTKHGRGTVKCQRCEYSGPEAELAAEKQGLKV